MMAFTLLISHMHSNVNEPYGRLVHPADEDSEAGQPR